MNREIKFRAWNKEQGQMYDWKTLTGRKGVGIFTWIEAQNRTGNLHNALMQYTGFPNEKGVEIYEGDIVLLPDFHPETPSNSICEVRWHGGHWQLYIHSECLSESLEDHADYIEVIGNIHQNPELLK